MGSKKVKYPQVRKLEDVPIFSPQQMIKMRKKIYLTQTEMAVYLRVSVVTYRSWEYGTRFPALPAWCYFLVQYNRIRKIIEDGDPLGIL